jgi:hypothetical protein
MQSQRPEEGFNTLKSAFENSKPLHESKGTRMKNNNSFNFNMNLGRYALLAIGGYVLWRNRFRVQRLLEANGIETPWMKGSFGEAVQSGVAKVTGSIQHAAKPETDRDIAI